VKTGIYAVELKNILNDDEGKEHLRQW